MTPFANAIPPALRAFLLAVFVGMIGVPPVFAEELSADEQARLAQQFAPVLVFHNAEKFFPVSPLFPIIANPPTSDKETMLLRLGTTKSRTAAYLEMNLDEKANLA